MQRNILPRHAMGWTRPYGTHPFSPVFYADGGGGDGSGSSNSGGTGGDGAAQGQQGGQAGGQSGANSGSGQGGAADNQQDAAATIARLEKDLADARAEAGKARTTAKANAANEAVQQLTQDIGKALGLIKDDEKGDPAKLTEQLTAAQKQSRQTAVELAVYRAAGKAGANPDALLDSRQFVATLADIDPADSNAVSAAVALALQNNPTLSAAPAGPARGGADLSGGGGSEPRQLTEEDLKTMTPEQIVKAQDDGLLRNLLGG